MVTVDVCPASWPGHGGAPPCAAALGRVLRGLTRLRLRAQHRALEDVLLRLRCSLFSIVAHKSGTATKCIFKNSERFCPYAFPGRAQGTYTLDAPRAYQIHNEVRSIEYSKPV